MALFSNNLRQNAGQYYKDVVIYGKVFVDKDALDAMTEANPERGATECFEELAREQLTDNVFHHSDEPLKVDSIEF